MTKQISTTLRLSVLSAALLLGTFDARAQTAYSGDNNHYLQVPQGYQQTNMQASTSMRTFNGQGVGQGQLVQQQQAMQQPQTVTTTATVSPRMLPQGAGTQTVTVQSPVASSLAPLTVQPAVQPVAQPVKYQAASIPSAQTLAAMEPAAGSSFDAGTNVSLTPACGSPSNHRQHKGINTSTTVGNDCFN